jgi:hypothetical protein
MLAISRPRALVIESLKFSARTRKWRRPQWFCLRHRVPVRFSPRKQHQTEKRRQVKLLQGGQYMMSRFGSRGARIKARICISEPRPLEPYWNILSYLAGEFHIKVHKEKIWNLKYKEELCGPNIGPSILAVIVHAHLISVHFLVLSEDLNVSQWI